MNDTTTAAAAEVLSSYDDPDQIEVVDYLTHGVGHVGNIVPGWTLVFRIGQTTYLHTAERDSLMDISATYHVAEPGEDGSVRLDHYNGDRVVGLNEPLDLYRVFDDDEDRIDAFSDAMTAIAAGFDQAIRVAERAAVRRTVEGYNATRGLPHA